MKRTIKRIIAFILIVSMTLTSSYTPWIGKNSRMRTVEAAGTVWDGTADTSWYTGDRDSYDISTAEQLAGFAQLCDEAAHEDRFRGVTINLTADIVLNDTKNFKNWGKKAPKNEWNPIGKQGSAIMGYCPFAGEFKGNGHTITGMYVENTDYGFWGVTDRAGFFECICGAVVTDLKFNQAYVASSGPAGVLAGISESSFVSGIEVTNSKVMSLDGAAGGVIGSCHQFVMTYMMSFFILAAMGVFVNPILYGDEAAEEIFGEHGTVLSDCRVDNLAITLKKGGNNSAGGIVGAGRTGIASSQVSHLTVTDPTGDCGIIVGANPKDNSNVFLKSNTYYSCEIKSDNKKSFIDKGYSQNLKKTATIKVGAKKSQLTIQKKKLKKKSKTISLKCKTNSTGTLTYKVSKTPKKGNKYIKVSTSGKVTLKKKAPKGTYKIKVSVQENEAFTKAEKTVSIKVK